MKTEEPQDLIPPLPVKKQYHILNGDSLKNQFPESIKGEIIVARECLVDGNVQGKNLEELFYTRAQFISNNYQGYTEQDYYDKTVREFQKIQRIPEDAEVNLWFEDDLFCQVNFWFTIYLLSNEKPENPAFLIRPITHTQYGFGGLKNEELIYAYENRLLLTTWDKLVDLWKWYQNDDHENLIKTAKGLENRYPFILSAVEAHLDRIPKGGFPGRPIQSLIEIIQELETEEFGPVFSEFNKREAIYGFGDLQVKRLLGKIKNGTFDIS